MRRIVDHKNIVKKFLSLIIATVSVAVLLSQSASAGPNDGFSITLDTVRTAPQTTKEGDRTDIASSPNNIPMYHFISGRIPLSDATASRVTVTLVNDDGTTRNITRAGSTPGVPASAGGFTTQYVGNILVVRGLNTNSKYTISVVLDDSKAPDVVKRLSEIKRVCDLSSNTSDIQQAVIDKVSFTAVDGQSTCDTVGNTTALPSFMPRLTTFEVGTTSAPLQTSSSGLVAAFGNKVAVEEPQQEESGQETCAIDGIGWIVCPVSGFIGLITDGVYILVERLLVFKVDDPFGNNPIFTVWSSIRNLANVAFIFAFFAIIFSQATSVGITNYGIKKMLPRLIIAAILVNLSYYLCIFAVDLSNIIGAGMSSILGVALDQIAEPQRNDLNWSSVIALVLSGTAATAGAVTILGPTGGAAILGAALAFGIAALFAIFTALVILVGRQAILILLIALSPLAFVAYILPNTEDWFNKWRKLFVTLLVFYPLVAILFYGSQIAAAIMRTGSPNALVDIFSLGVTAFPLFATPFLLKFSGGLLGRIAGVVNNPNKGPFDKLRKAGESRIDTRRKRDLGNSLSGNRKNKFAVGMARRSARRRAEDTSMERFSKNKEAEYIGGQLIPGKDGNPVNQKFANRMAGASMLNRNPGQDAIMQVMAEGAQTVDEIEAKSLKAAQVVLSNARMDGIGLKRLVDGNNAVGLNNGQKVQATETMRMAAASMMMGQGREMDTVVKTLVLSGNDRMRNFAVGQMQANYSKSKEKQLGLTDEKLMEQISNGDLKTEADFDYALQVSTVRRAPGINAEILASQEDSSSARIKVGLIDVSGTLTPEMAIARDKIREISKQAQRSPSTLARMTPGTRSVVDEAAK